MIKKIYKKINKKIFLFKQKQTLSENSSEDLLKYYAKNFGGSMRFFPPAQEWRVK